MTEDEEIGCNCPAFGGVPPLAGGCEVTPADVAFFGALQDPNVSFGGPAFSDQYAVDLITAMSGVDEVAEVIGIAMNENGCIGVADPDFIRSNIDFFRTYPGAFGPLKLPAQEALKRVIAERNAHDAYPRQAQVIPGDVPTLKKRALDSMAGNLDHQLEFKDSTGWWVISPGQLKLLADHAVWYENGQWYQMGVPFPPNQALTKYRIFRVSLQRWEASQRAHNNPGFFKKLSRSVKGIGKAAGKFFSDVGTELGKVAFVGPVLSALYTGVTGPITLAANVASGTRIDKAVMRSFKAQLKGAQDLAPYVQTVVSFVPGVGTGISAAIGAANALSKGQPITEALLEGVKGALPGGPVAAAAFDVAVSVVNGKPVEDIVINALPLPAAQKELFIKGMHIAKAIANGERVDEAVFEEAKQLLPAEAQKAITTAIALAQGKNLQKIVMEEVPGLVPQLAALGGKDVSPVLNAGRAMFDKKGVAAFDTAIGLMKHKVTPLAIASARSALPEGSRKAFDVGMQTHLNAAKRMTAQNAASRILNSAFARKNYPMKPSAQPRIEVCGAKSEEARGVWLKVHIYQEGTYLHAVIYSVANADAKILNFKVNLKPIVEGVARLHGASISGDMHGNITAVAKKLGKAKLANAAFAASKALTAKARCKVQKPNVPVSDAALTAFAAARKGVDAVDSNAKMQASMMQNQKDLTAYLILKKKLLALSPAQRAEALKNPVTKALVLRGAKAKVAVAKFIAAGGPARAKELKATAAIAAQKFNNLSQQTKSSNPIIREDAKTMSKIVGITAKARAETQNAVTNNQGGLPGLVIDARGRIRKSKKGFFKRNPRANERAQVYIPQRGPVQTGSFDTVSGLNWKAGAKERQNRLRKIRVMNSAVRNSADDIQRISNKIAQYSRIGGWRDDFEVSGRPLASGVGASHKSLSAKRILDAGYPVLSEKQSILNLLANIRKNGAQTVQEKRLVAKMRHHLARIGVGASESAPGARSEVRSPTRTSTEVRSPTSTSTEVRSPTSTSTEAYTQGNFTLTATGGAGAGATHVTVNLPGYPLGHHTRVRTPPPNGVFAALSDPRPRSTGIFDNVGPETVEDIVERVSGAKHLVSGVNYRPIPRSTLLQRLAGIHRISNMETTNRERSAALRKLKALAKGRLIGGIEHVYPYSPETVTDWFENEYFGDFPEDYDILNELNEHPGDMLDPHTFVQDQYTNDLPADLAGSGDY